MTCLSRLLDEKAAQLLDLLVVELDLPSLMPSSTRGDRND
jgi:hypothetical protein